MLRLGTLILISLLLSAPNLVLAQDCLDSEIEVIVEIFADDYPSEISWDLMDADSNILAQGNSTGDTLCIDSNLCLIFNIYDFFGDGICCNFGLGSYGVLLDGELAASGGDYDFSDTWIFNCPPGYSCDNPIPVSPGSYVADHDDFWYIFTPDITGIYTVNTCLLDTCDTKLWIYDHCRGVNASENNAGSIYYNDNAGDCGEQAQIIAYLEESQTYYIRVGSAYGDCTGAIAWELIFGGEILGCMDSTSCNYNPLATVEDGSCLPPGDPDCGDGPDLIVLEDVFRNTLRGDVTNSANVCRINEGCLHGFGTRQIVRFTTHFQNIGDLDYFIGNPALQPEQFSYDNCHGHYHYEGYAEYRMYDDQNQKMTNGFKNGFCISDLECDGGGTEKFGCGNQGVSAGCGDYYSWVIPCQWVDVTDIPDGDYTLVNTVNWNRTPDAVGNYELRYDNNWAQACFNLSRIDGVPEVVLLDTCPVVTDCEGIPFGDVEQDCAGICGGPNIYGDLNGDSELTTADAEAYVFDIINGGLEAHPCYDLNDDSFITVFDAALANDCYLLGNAHPHTGGGNIHNHCNLPGGIVNPTHTARLTIMDYDPVNNTIDIGISNPQDHVNAYEFNMSGMEIISVISLVDQDVYPTEPQYQVGGNKIISISLTDSIIPKTDGSYQPLCRIAFTSTGDAEVCIDTIIDIINELNHKVNTEVVDGCTEIISGVRDLYTNHNLHIYPNPSTGLIQLSYKLNETEDISIEVVNQLGQLVLENHVEHTRADQVWLDLSEEEAGFYFIRFRSEGGISTKKVVIAR